MWSPSSDTASFVPVYFLHPIAPPRSLSLRSSLRPTVVIPWKLRISPRLASIELVLHLLLFFFELLALLEDLLHFANVLNDDIERGRDSTGDLVSIVFSAVLPDSLHERCIDLFELFERAA